MRLMVAVALSCCCGVALSGQQATVIHNVNLRPGPSSAPPSLGLLTPPAALTLLQPAPTSGYYRVRTAQNDSGWVWGKNVVVDAVPADDAPGPPLPAPGTWAGTNAACPSVGSHKVANTMTAYDDTSDAGLRNRAKRHVPVGTDPVTLDLFSFHALQDDVNSRYTDAHDQKTPFHPDRTGLANRPVANAIVSEGDLVQIVAYVVAVRPEGPESVNCAGADGKDIHINVGPKNATEWKGVVVEIIPQLGHPVGWDSAHIARVRAAGLPVLVVGGLTYDNEHLVNDDPAHAKQGQPKRISLWEIHPITEFYVCVVTTCNPANHAEWTTLTAWARAQDQ